MKNKIEDLHNHLFAAIEGLLDEDKPLDIARAKAVSDVAQTVINLAKVQVAYADQTGKVPTLFEDTPRVPALKAVN